MDPPFPIDELCVCLEPRRPLSGKENAQLSHAVDGLATWLGRNGDRLSAMKLLWAAMSDVDRAAFLYHIMSDEERAAFMAHSGLAFGDPGPPP